MKDKLVRKYYGLTVRRKVRVTIEIELSEDHADCIVAQAQNLLDGKVEYPDWDHKDLRDLTEAIAEALK